MLAKQRIGGQAPGLRSARQVRRRLEQARRAVERALVEDLAV